MARTLTILIVRGRLINSCLPLLLPLGTLCMPWFGDFNEKMRIFENHSSEIFQHFIFLENLPWTYSIFLSYQLIILIIINSEAASAFDFLNDKACLDFGIFDEKIKSFENHSIKEFSTLDLKLFHLEKSCSYC